VQILGAVGGQASFRFLLHVTSISMVPLLFTSLCGQQPVQPAPTQTPDSIPKVLRAERFELVDKDGQVRAQLRTNGDATVFELLDQHGKIRATLMSVNDTTAFVVGGSGGGTKTQEDRIVLLTSKGESFITLGSAAHETRFHVGVSADGLPTLTLMGNSGAVALGFFGADPPQIAINGKKRGLALTLAPDGSGIEGLYDKSGNPRVVLRVNDGEGSVTSYDKSGKEKQSVPLGPSHLFIGPPILTGAGYPGVGSAHWIQTVSDNGRIITLEDGSLWDVQSIDRINTALWLPITDIVVKLAPSPIGEYRYQLINKDDGETALVKYLGNE
jgi:hypothetical protein